MSKASFRDYALSGEITKALDHLGYRQPTVVQSKVIPESLKKRDVVVKSQTGSGKTAAFGIPLCELTEWEENKPQALILTPTRELAAQVKEDLTNIGRYKRIKAAAVYGKSSFERQKTELSQKCHIVVGTPGRVLDHMKKGTFPLEKLKCLVIDEADEMLNMGFIDQVGAIIRHLPEERMTMLFSATFPEDVENLSLQYMKAPLKIEIKASGMTTADIEHQLIIVNENDTFLLLVDMLIVENPDSCILFCRTQEHVNELHRRLAGLGYPCAKIHGGMPQEERFAVMNRFRRGDFRYLIATDVAARGIDIEDVTHVINYELPLDKESYVHRTGRTGRAGRRGKAITFSSPREKRMIAEIEDYIGFSIPVIQAPSKEEIARAKEAFLKKINTKPELKKDKSEPLNKEIMRLYFNGGKKKKLRAVDFVGTIAKIDGVSAEDIGIITIQEQGSFVEILNGKGPLVLDAMKKTTVKGKLLKVHKARK
ncbi:DEAD/DEAH box helicase [Bacillus glycinifermentans]|uniref:ATP-dependent RNA helicase DbpA n=1 Tax=Bacillus glycinifermentans TaxID=1664069 RepID=A0A0T6BJE5_9BACI|nr:DEAD/DEAH box helicase [Bacillus glycinifermentans]ATH93807.1 ATP-dependent helicase [Bacillus glycinifermentans]KRT90015.1 RNA helicase [Bacillus glycinifermentans]MEC0483691.1 DEAD/DEAH box helicase [Bacillus glycinifermentans]